MSFLDCNNEDDLSKEQRQLTSQLSTWQQQIQQLVQREAGLPKPARSSLRGPENRAPLPAAVTAAQCASPWCSDTKAGPNGRSNTAPLRSRQSSSYAPSVQQLTCAASQKQTPRPEATAIRDATQHASLTSERGMHEAETRRMRMRQRLQAAEHRRAKAKEQAQVQPDC